MWFLYFLAVWFTFGLLAVIAVVVHDLYNGVEFHTPDIISLVLSCGLGPVAFLLVASMLHASLFRSRKEEPPHGLVS